MSNEYFQKRRQELLLKEKENQSRASVKIDSSTQTRLEKIEYAENQIWRFLNQKLGMDPNPAQVGMYLKLLLQLKKAETRDMIWDEMDRLWRLTLQIERYLENSTKAKPNPAKVGMYLKLLHDEFD